MVAIMVSICFVMNCSPQYGMWFSSCEGPEQGRARVLVGRSVIEDWFCWFRASQLLESCCRESDFGHSFTGKLQIHINKYQTCCMIQAVQTGCSSYRVVCILKYNKYQLLLNTFIGHKTNTFRPTCWPSSVVKNTNTSIYDATNFFFLQ
jgi:hypothetical protein